MSQLLKVYINSPDKRIWEGEAQSVSSVNTNGPFDILPLHANFVTFVENKPIRIRVSGQIQEYTFEHAVIYAHQNTVSVYTTI